MYNWKSGFCLHGFLYTECCFSIPLKSLSLIIFLEDLVTKYHCFPEQHGIYNVKNDDSEAVDLS